MGRQKDFEPHEDARLIAGERDLPGRTNSSVWNRLVRLQHRFEDEGKPIPPGLRRTGRRDSWKPGEITAIKAGATELPGRTATAIRGKISELRAKGQMPAHVSGKEWSEADIAALRAGRRDFPGRSVHSIRRACLRYIPGFKAEKQPRWTPEEDAAIVRDPRTPLPGRSWWSRRHRVLALGRTLSVDYPLPRIVRPPPSGRTHWRPEEVEALIRDPRAAALDRTDRARRDKLKRLGILMRRDYPLAPRPRIYRPVAPFAGSVLAASSAQAEGFDLLQAIAREIPPHTALNVREEAIGTAALLVLEHGLTPREAVREALPQARAFLSQFRTVEFRDDIFHP